MMPFYLFDIISAPNQTYYSFWWWWQNSGEMLAEINSRINTADNGTYAGFEATWAMVVTWEDIPEVTSTQNTDNVSTKLNTRPILYLP